MPTVSPKEPSHSFSFLTVLQPPAPSRSPPSEPKTNAPTFQDNGDHQKRIPSASVPPSCCLHTHLWFFPSCPSARGSLWSKVDTFSQLLPNHLGASFFCFCLQLSLLSSAFSADSFLVVQSPSCIQLFGTPWTAAHQVSLSITSPRVCPRLCSLHRRCHPANSSSDTLFSFCPQSFPALGTSSMSRLLSSDDQNTGASPLVLPVNIQGWFPFRLACLISLLSKGLSGIFSNTSVQRHQFFGLLPSFQSSSHNRM